MLLISLDTLLQYCKSDMQMKPFLLRDCSDDVVNLGFSYEITRWCIFRRKINFLLYFFINRRLNSINVLECKVARCNVDTVNSQLAGKPISIMTWKTLILKISTVFVKMRFVPIELCDNAVTNKLGFVADPDTLKYPM